MVACAPALVLDVSLPMVVMVVVALLRQPTRGRASPVRMPLTALRGFEDP